MALEERRAGQVKATVTSDVPGVRLLRVRPAGDEVEVDLIVEAKRSGHGTYRVRVEGDAAVVEGEGQIAVERADPVHVDMQSVIGVPVSADIPLVEDLWQNKQFHARMEPELGCFTISCAKGVCAAGAKSMPFRVFFNPKDARPVEVTLIVDFGDFEVTALVRGSVGGFAGRRWANRRRGANEG
jgi:hypothetical protein